MKWNVTITLPEVVTQERLAEELNELCQAGFDLDNDEYTIEINQAPTTKVERTGTEG